MLVRLIEPGPYNSACNWLLQGEGLRDPAGWTRFVPIHSVDSDRFRFESLVKELDSNVKVTLRKNLLDEGKSVFEYDWTVNEDAILEHALQIAENLKVELVLGATSKAA